MFLYLISDDNAPMNLIIHQDFKDVLNRFFAENNIPKAKKIHKDKNLMFGTIDTFC